MAIKYITVITSDWCVPFDQVVRHIRHFSTEDEAVEFINSEAKKWWDANDGDRCLVEYPDTEPFSPVKELGYDYAHYELWGGEQGFHAMLDHETYARLHEAHYKREYDDKGIDRPGYLIVAELSGNKPN